MGNMIRNKFYLCIFTLVTFLLIFSSCSLDKNRKILKIFFDGVPDKEKKVDISLKKEKKKAPDKVITLEPLQNSIHPDFKNRNCSKCHNKTATNFLVTDKKKLCFLCHKKDKFNGPYIHGPVAARACDTCHDPHRSNNSNLLLGKTRKLCDLCHNMPLTNVLIQCKGDNCLECHTPHVSDNKFFLLNNVNVENKNISSDQNYVKKTDNKKMVNSLVISKKEIENSLDNFFKLRSFDHKDFTRIVIELKKTNKFTKLIKNKAVIFEFNQISSITELNTLKNYSHLVSNIDIKGSIITVHFRSKIEVIKEELLDNPFRIVTDLREDTNEAYKKK